MGAKKGGHILADYVATGVDISQFNGDVDIAGLRGVVDFVIIRCGYGSDYASQDDTRYQENVAKCEAAGMPYGVYLYSYARNEAMARSEARHTLRLLQGRRPLYGVWYDVEDVALPTGETLIDDCVAYCTEIEAAGLYCGIYSSLSWWRSRLNSPRLERFDKWVAQWNSTLDYPGAGIWQYTSDGVIHGKRFDMDRAFRDYPAIIRGMEGTDMTREEVAQLAREEAQAVYEQNERKYPRISSLPEWARGPVEEVYTQLGLLGTGERQGDTQINASETYVRALVVVDRVLQLIDGLGAETPGSPEE